MEVADLCNGVNTKRTTDDIQRAEIPSSGYESTKGKRLKEDSRPDRETQRTLERREEHLYHISVKI